MKSTLAILALALGNAAAEEAFIHGSGGHKLRHHGHKKHHARTKMAHAVGKELRFAKATDPGAGAGNNFPCDPGAGASEKVHWHTDPVSADKYRIKCSEGAGKGRLGCEGGAWTILKSGYTVACQWLKKDDASGKWIKGTANIGECKGLGEPADGCERMYQTIPDDVFNEKLR